MYNNIGITGVNGFVGETISKKMKKNGGKVLKLSTNPQDPSIIKLHDGVPQYSNNISTIIHCGGIVGNGHKDYQYEYGNVICTKNLIRWSEEHGVKHFIYISSGSVYGSNKDWVDEETAINPQDDYSYSKVKAENIIKNSYIQSKTILRLYFPLGDFSKNHFFSRLNDSILSGKEIFLNDEEGHPFISPIDIADLYILLEKIVLDRVDGIYNLSANYSINIKEIVSIISGFHKIRPNYIFRSNNVGNYLGCSNKIMFKLGYKNFENPKKTILKYLRMRYKYNDKTVEK